MRSVLVALLVLGAGCSDLRVVQVSSPEGELRLEACADQARSASERMAGLSGRERLADDEALLIVFPTEGEVCIDNGGVPFAIDVVYFDASGAAVAVESGVAADDVTARCHGPTRTVLEVGVGRAAAVVEGDRLTVD